MFVRDWMSQPAVSVTSSTRLEAARSLMHKKRIRRVPVVERGRLVGILTRSDIDKYAEGKTVADAMTRNPVSVSPNETLEGAAVAMTSRRISGLPVVDGAKVVGMITETDVFRALIDILGFDEGGARVVLSLNGPDSLQKWLQKFSSGLQVRSLIVYRDPSTRQWKALARLWGRKKKVAASYQPV